MGLPFFPSIFTTCHNSVEFQKRLTMKSGAKSWFCKPQLQSSAHCQIKLVLKMGFAILVQYLLRWRGDDLGPAVQSCDRSKVGTILRHNDMLI